ncbi:MAG: hypothetical protein HFE81_06350 [Bacilli bacterium]|nr:hypothetical protein [Bacilli bacterium]
MNREILFKAKRKDNGKWVYGYLVEYTFKDTIYIDGTSQKISYIFPMYERSQLKSLEKRIEVIPETICQYTGLKDKNDVKIFENDKVKYDYKFSEETGIITYNQENASWQIKGIPSSSMKHHNKLIKLGNVFDKEVK